MPTSRRSRNGSGRRHDAIAICDEVWEHVVFDGHRHASVLGRPDMRERTVKISSAGKIFSLTGWKVGLVMAAPAIMRVLSKAHEQRNLAEYEGHVDIDERLLLDLITACETVATTIERKEESR